MSTTNGPMRSTLLLGVSIIRKISRQRRMFTRRNGCPGSISSTLEFASSRRYEIRPRKDHRGVDVTSDVIPFGRLWYGEPDAINNAIGYAKFYSRLHDAVIRVYDNAGNVIETHEHTGDFKEWGRASETKS
jgi:hypothetical protein